MFVMVKRLSPAGCGIAAGFPSGAALGSAALGGVTTGRAVAAGFGTGRTGDVVGIPPEYFDECVILLRLVNGLLVDDRDEQIGDIAQSNLGPL